MPRASEIILNEVDLTQTAAEPPKGISGVIGVFPMGPLSKPSLLITSVAQFEKIYGIDKENVAYNQALRALQRGSSLRVNNIRHYTNISSASTLTALKADYAEGIVVSVAAPLTDGTIEVTVNGTAISQAYTSSNVNTLNLLINKIKTQSNGLIYDVVKMNVASAPFEFLLLPNADPIIISANTTGANPPAITTRSVNEVANSTGTPLFKITPKYPGTIYNNLKQTIKAASNGNASYFDLQIDFLSRPDLSKTYTNIRIPGTPTITASKYLDELKTSNIVDVEYFDLSGLTAPIRPINSVLKFTGGTNGGSVVDSDYLGSQSTKTGFYAFDGIDDMSQIAVLDSDSRAVHVGGAAYVDSRRDLMYFIHFANSFNTAQALVDERDATLIDNSYVAFFTGGIVIPDGREVSGIGDVLGIAAYSDNQYGPYISFTGPRRGIITNALSVVNNFGPNYKDRDYLANHQINVLSAVNGKMQIQGNFTGQLAQSDLSYMNVRRMLIGLKKLIEPFLQNYIEEPNDIPTWKLIYMGVRPLLADWYSKRAFEKMPDWEGDQFANNMDDLKINDAHDVAQGFYKVQLFVTPTKSIQQIQIDITLTPSGVSFEDILSLTNNNIA